MYPLSIKAYDTDAVEKDALFEIPITVVQPHVINCEETRTFEPSHPNGSMEFQPNTIQRDFVLVPPNATWAGMWLLWIKTNKNILYANFY